MKPSIEKQMHSLLKKVSGKHPPFPNIANDIEEFINVGEWELALEHILDWAAAEKKLSMAEKEVAQIRTEMKRLSAKKSN